VSWYTAEERMMDWHMRSGLALLGVLTFRVFWGFAGPETARFASFVKGPRSVIAYAGSLFSGAHRLTFGHNPLGALSVVAILLALAAQVGFGLFSVDTDGLESGPLARFVSYGTAEAAADLHEATFNILLGLIGLHLAAVAFYLVVKRANLIGPMLTGRRRLGVHAEPAARPMKPAPFTRILLGVALGVLAVWLVTR
jgi:cytochrome b